MPGLLEAATFLHTILERIRNRDGTQLVSTIDIDALVIGAGVIGLACARALALSGRDTILLERTSEIGSQTSSRNSEVIHAGLYYPTGSNKAKFCVAGRRALYRYLADRQIDYRKCGKLIVASGPDERQALIALQQKAADNGVENIEFLPPDQVRRLEPALSDSVSGALYSRETGIFDSHAFMVSLLGDLEQAGGSIAYQSHVLGGRVESNSVILEIGGSEAYDVRANTVVNAAGLQALDIARAISGPHVASLPQAHFAKGRYFSVTGKVPFRHLIYPMPNNAGLGTHLTLDLSGRGRLGPDVAWVEPDADGTFDYSIPESLADTFHKAATRFWPDLQIDNLQPAYAGIRPKLVGPSDPPADFLVQHKPNSPLINLLGIESPGLTSSLAIADFVALSMNGREGT